MQAHNYVTSELSGAAGRPVWPASTATSPFVQFVSNCAGLDRHFLELVSAGFFSSWLEFPTISPIDPAAFWSAVSCFLHLCPIGADDEAGAATSTFI